MLQLKWNSGKLHNTFFTHCYSQTFTSPTFLTHCWTFRWECVKLYQIRHQSDRTPNWKLVSAAVSHWDQHSVPQTSRPGFVLYNSSRCFLFLNVTKKKGRFFPPPLFHFLSWFLFFLCASFFCYNLYITVSLNHEYVSHLHLANNHTHICGNRKCVVHCAHTLCTRLLSFLKKKLKQRRKWEDGLTARERQGGSAGPLHVSPNASVLSHVNILDGLVDIRRQ